jgi:type IV secretion system protein VirD4
MRNALILLASLAVGLFVGILIAGVFLAVTFGHNVNSMDMLFFLDYLPNERRWGRSPYQEAYIIVGVIPVLALGIATFALTRMKLSKYGNAHFQTKSELRRNDMLEPMGAGLLLGRQIKPPVPPKNAPLVIIQDRHSWKQFLPEGIKVRWDAYRAARPGPFISPDYDKFPNALVIAPSGSGKTVGYVIATTIISPGSMVIFDAKGELFEKTARLRESYGDKVFYFAPFDFDHPTHQYNPLHRMSLHKDPERQFTELRKLSSLFLQTKGAGSQDFVGGGTELFTAAGMLAIQRGNPTFGEIYRILYGEGGEIGEEIEVSAERLFEAAKEVHYFAARQIFVEYAGYDTKIRDSYTSVLKTAGLRQWSNPRVERVTRRNEIDFTTIRKQQQTIYVSVKSDDIEELDALLRLFFSELIQFLRQSEPGPDEPHTVQIMLDEFFQLGYMPIVVKALLQLRSHGARVSIIIQSLFGLGAIYSKEEVDILKTGSVKLYITANENETAKEIETSLGSRTGVSATRSKDIDAVGPNSGSVSISSEKIPLLDAEEIQRLDETKVIIIAERQYPILAERISYFSDPDLAPLYNSQDGPLPYPDEALSVVKDMKDDEKLKEARIQRAALKASNGGERTNPQKNDPDVSPNNGEPEASAPEPDQPNNPKDGEGGAEAMPSNEAKDTIRGVAINVTEQAQNSENTGLTEEAEKSAMVVSASANGLGPHDA